MKVSVNIHYNTHWGERLRLRLSDGVTVDMNASADGLWQASFAIGDKSTTLDYAVELIDAHRVLRTEWHPCREVHLDKGVGTVALYDAWREMPECRAFYSSLFTDVVFAHEVEARPILKEGEVYVEVEAPTLRPDERLALSGASAKLGEWDTKRTRPMTHYGKARWGIVLGCGDIEGQVPFKFVVTDSCGNLLRWEEGDNRCLPATSAERVTVLTGLRLRERLWWRGAGLAVPVFSLRSEESFGVGEFADLRKLADWCERCGQRIIQILPINDTTITNTVRDSYPYNSNSTFALHPMYIRLSEVGRLKDKKLQAKYDKIGKELNSEPTVVYDKVNAAKTECLRLLYEEYGAEHLASKAYRAFYEKNASWLESYATFSVLRDMYSTADFSQWGEYAVYNEEKCAAFAATHRKDVDFYCFVQYHLDKQLREVRDYVHSKGVVLKGDIPIGISRTSVDAWTVPHLFVMNSSAGAPPDDFSVTGQNWGFPIYNWEEMAKDDYAWWRRRFTKMAEYFDAYRIDHILGFFRIWEIPLDAVNALLGEFNPSMPYSVDEICSYGYDFNPELEVARDYSSDNVLWLEYRHKPGYYYPRITPFSTPMFAALPEYKKRAFEHLYNDFYYYRHNEFWKDVAVKRLSTLIDSTSMLTCGEDLGMIPHCVPEVMRSEQILSLEIERMPKSVEHNFAPLAQYPYLSICTTSTHDMNPIRAWWREDRANTQRYYNEVMEWWGEAPDEATPEVCRNIVERHLAAPSILTVLPLQDWLSIDGQLRTADAESERINIPADPHHYWRYRMHLTIEQLLASDDFTELVRELIHRSGR